MTDFEIKLRKRMDEAAKEDRERFFRVADTLQFQPKYKDKLADLEIEKQKWRDMTALTDYPNIDFPMELPEWFPKIHFANNWRKDISIADNIKDAEIREIERNLLEQQNGGDSVGHS